MSVQSAPSFQEELRALINRHSMESLSHTPDFILAQLLTSVLTDWNHAVKARDRWYGEDHSVVLGRYTGSVHFQPKETT